MSAQLTSLAFNAYAMVADAAAGVAIYLSQERGWVLGVTTYLMTAFVTGNIMSAVWNIYLRSGGIA